MSDLPSDGIQVFAQIANDTGDGKAIVKKYEQVDGVFKKYALNQKGEWVFIPESTSYPDETIHLLNWDYTSKIS